MRTGNERLMDALLTRHVHLGKYADGLGIRVGDILRTTDEAVADRVLSAVARIDGRYTTVAGQARLARLDEAVMRLRAEAWNEVRALIRAELAALAVAESRYLTDAATEAMPVVLDLTEPPASELRATVPGLIVMGSALSYWMRRAQVGDAERIARRVRLALVQQATPRQAADMVRGTRTVPGALRTAANDAAANADTAVTAIEAEARRITDAANEPVLGRERFIATLDLSTTLVCRRNDGRVFGVNEGPALPLHWRCRSLRVPAVFAKALGDRPYKLGVIGRDRYSVGRVPAATAYRDWIKNQPAEFQRYAGDRRRVIRSLDELAAAA